MTRPRKIKIEGLVRDPMVTPKIDGLLGRVAPESQQEFVALIGQIWGELRQRFAHPIETGECARRRTVTVLRLARFALHRKTGAIALEQAGLTKRGRKYLKVDYAFSVDLPMMPTLGLFECLLSEWAAKILFSARCREEAMSLLHEVTLAIRRATLRALCWKKLRHAVRAALAIDPDILDLARRTRLNVHHREVTDRHFNFVVAHVNALRQIRNDNPNLLWLYKLAHEERADIAWKGREAVQALRESILQSFNLPPSAWRHLAHGRRRDFRVVLDWLGPNVNPKGRWLELRDWLRLLVALERDTPVPLPVQRLFLHDHYRVVDPEHVILRGARLSIRTLRCLIDAAERQMRAGTLAAFAAMELTDVLAWCVSANVKMDEQQQRAGWPWLVRQAADWKHERRLQEESATLRWESLIGAHASGALRVEPVTDVWRLHRESLLNRNCAVNYLKDCLAGTVRIFAVFSAHERQVGTIGLTRSGLRWEVLDARGFANTPPSEAVAELAHGLAERYTTLWQTLQPLLEQQHVEPASLPPRSENDSPFAAEKQSEEPEGECDETDEDDEDQGEEEEENDRVCPFCGDAEFACQHLLAVVDYFNGGLCHGELYLMRDRHIPRLWQHILRCAGTGRLTTGLGADFDAVLGNVKAQILRGDDPDDIESDNTDAIWNAFFSFLETLPGIIDHDWEFDSGMPCFSTCGKDYWSKDPKASIRLLESLLVPRASRAEGRDDVEALPQDTLTDPMAESAESLMKMREKGKG